MILLIQLLILNQEDLTRVHLYYTNEFKKNLKTLIKSEWKIENLVKAFDNDSQFLLNKTFAGFKKHFSEHHRAHLEGVSVRER